MQLQHNIKPNGHMQYLKISTTLFYSIFHLEIGYFGQNMKRKQICCCQQKQQKQKMSVCSSSELIVHRSLQLRWHIKAYEKLEFMQD